MRYRLRWSKSSIRDCGLKQGFRDVGRPRRGLLKTVDIGLGRAILRTSAARDRLCLSGGVAEWLKAADCKSADVRLRRFESYPLHHVVAASQGAERSYAGVAQW